MYAPHRTAPCPPIHVHGMYMYVLGRGPGLDRWNGERAGGVELAPPSPVGMALARSYDPRPIDRSMRLSIPRPSPHILVCTYIIPVGINFPPTPPALLGARSPGGTPMPAYSRYKRGVLAGLARARSCRAGLSVLCTMCVCAVRTYVRNYICGCMYVCMCTHGWGPVSIARSSLYPVSYLTHPAWPATQPHRDRHAALAPHGTILRNTHVTYPVRGRDAFTYLIFRQRSPIPSTHPGEERGEGGGKNT